MISMHYDAGAYSAAFAIRKNKPFLNTSIERLSTGYRINQPSDGIADYIQSVNFQNTLRGYEEVGRDIAKAEQFMNQVEDSQEEIVTLLTTMSDLAEQAMDAGLTDLQRAELDLQFVDARDEIDRIVSQTRFNGSLFLDGTYGGGSPLVIQTGTGPTDTLDIVIENHDSATLGIGALTVAGPGTANATTAFNTINTAATGGTAVGTGFDVLNDRLANSAGTRSRLTSAKNIADSVQQNTIAMISVIRDIDVATEAINYTRHSLIQQTGLSMLSQSNISQQGILALFNFK